MQRCLRDLNVARVRDTDGLDFYRNCREGHASYNASNCAPSTALVSPVFDYSHDIGCSVTGGHVYRGPDNGLDGLYFYGDYCNRALYYADPGNGYWHDGIAGISGTLLDTGLDPGSGPIGFGKDLDGRLYVLTSNGRIWRIDMDALFADGFDQGRDW